MLKVWTTDGNCHEFSDASSRTSPDGVLVVTKYPHSMVPEFVQFPLVNVIKWEDGR